MHMHAVDQWVGRTRGARGRRTVASSKRDAMEREGSEGNVRGEGGASRVGKFRSRLDILALTTCIGRATHALRAHRRQYTVVVAAFRMQTRLARNCQICGTLSALSSYFLAKFCKLSRLVLILIFNK